MVSILHYHQLHRMALRYVAGERSDVSLQPTALVNEVCLRLLGWDQVAARIVTRNLDILERDAHGLGAATALRPALARDVDEHAPHHLRGHAEEVAAVFSPHLTSLLFTRDSFV